MYKQLTDALSGEDLEEFQQNMLDELAKSKSETERQAFKMTKTALKQVQDLVSLHPSCRPTFFNIVVCRPQRWEGRTST
jgi:hypothetical protein